MLSKQVVLNYIELGTKEKQACGGSAGSFHDVDLLKIGPARYQ
jgi:hypothetical protein